MPEPLTQGWSMVDDGDSTPSSAQQRLVFLDLLEPGSPAYAVTIAIELRGTLRPEALVASLTAVGLRHGAMRSVLRRSPSGVVRRHTRSDSPPVQIVDLGSEACAMDRVLERLVRRPVDLLVDPPARWLVLRASADRHVVVLATHHAFFDGGSLSVVSRDIEDAYAAMIRGRPTSAPPPTSGGPVEPAGERLADGDPGLRYWRRRLADLPSAPAVFARPPVRPSSRPHRVRSTVDRSLVRAVRALAPRLRCTANVVLTAALACLISRQADSEDIVLVTPVSTREAPGLDDVVGLFVNLLPLRVDLSGRPCFEDAVLRVRDAVLEGIEHRHVPLERIVGTVPGHRRTGAEPVFGIQIVHQPRPVPPSMPELDVRVLTLDSPAAKFGLSVTVTESADVVEIEMESSACDAAERRGVATRFQKLLRELVTAPRRPLAETPWGTEAEVRAAARTGFGPRRERTDAGLHELVAARASDTPDAVAVVAGPDHVSYQALVRRASEITGCLVAAGVRFGDRVAVLLERSATLPAALLGVLRAGAAYLPLAPDDPPDRRAAACRGADVAVVLTSTSLRSRVPDGVRAVCLDVPTEPTAPATVRRTSGRYPAYVLHTSGSTGGPKAVVVGHAAIANRVIWMQEHYRLGRDDRVLHKTPLTFDVSVWELFWPMTAGACVVLARPGGHLDGGYLASLARREEITTAYFVPSLLGSFLDALDHVGDRRDAVPQALPALRRVLCSGESLTAALRDRVRERLGSELSNLYGPTEAAIDVTAWRCTADLPVRIGVPIANVDVHVLDAEQRPLPPDASGELYIGGTALAHGYLHRPGATASVFRPDPLTATPGARLYRTGDRGRRLPDGTIEFLGRRDRQAKLRGVRIEPGEVEEALAGCPGVAAGAVAVRDGRLVAAIVARTGHKSTPGVVLAHLRERLPASMVPAAVVVLDALPRTSSGKVDLEAVTGMIPTVHLDSRGPAAEPLTETERRVSAAWCALLGRSDVDPHVNFFDAGGNSLLLVELHARLQRGVDPRVRVLDLFRHPTIAGLASALDVLDHGAAGSGREAIGRGRRRAALAGRRRGASGERP